MPPDSTPDISNSTEPKKRGGARPGAGRKRKVPVNSPSAPDTSQDDPPPNLPAALTPAPFFESRHSLSVAPLPKPLPALSPTSTSIPASNHIREPDNSLLSQSDWENLTSNLEFVLQNDENADIAGHQSNLEESMFESEEDVSMEESARIAAHEAEDAQAKAHSAIAEQLEEVLEDVKKEIKKHKMLKCYQRGDFWIRPRHPVFALHRGASITGFKPTYLYHKSIFIWLPSFLPGAPERFKCACGQYLNKHGFNDNPIARRVSSSPADYYLLTNRYLCNSRRRDTTMAGCGQTFQGTDPLIIGQLPRHVQEAFPCYLSHRGAVDKHLMNELRCTSSTRFGPKPFSEMQRELQALHHSQLELIYLAAARHYGKKDIPPFSSFTDPLAYNGASLSVHYFKSMFTEWYAAYRIFLNRVQASLPLTIAKADHTFKVIVHMAKVKGEPVHRALYTIVNEWEQVRGRAACLTKSLGYVDEHWKSISQGLEEHGHPATEYVWTDAPKAEQSFHESITKSLQKDVQHPVVDRWRDLPDFHPSASTKRTQYCDTYDSIDVTCDDILSSLEPDAPDTKLLIIVTVKSETEIVGVGGPEGIPRERGGHVDLLQLRVGSQLHIFRLTQLAAGNRMPPSLQALLSSSRIVKAGLQVQEAFEKLSRAFARPELAEAVRTSSGAILDLSQFAKLKGVVKDVRLPLSSLAPVVLQCRFPLPDDIRHVRWSLKLEQRHITYLENETECLWQIYTSLARLPSVGLPLQSPDVFVGKLVMLVLGEKEVAEGEVVGHNGHIMVVKDENGATERINITASRTAIRITKALVPGHILALYSQTIKWIVEHGSIAAVSTQTLCSRGTVSPLPASSSTSLGVPAPACNFDASLAAHSESQSFLPNTEFTQNFPETISDLNRGDGYYDPDDSDDEDEESSCIPDATYPGPHATGPLGAPCHSDSTIHSRILDDVFHFMDRLNRKLKKKHSVYKEFLHCFSRTIFIWDIDDTAAVKKVFEAKGIPWDYAVRAKADALRTRIRRYVSPPDKLYGDLKLLFSCFKDITCTLKPRKHERFFSEDAIKECENLLETVQLGLLSDPKDFPLYYLMGKDKDGLNRYRTIRGTNSIEGGVHMPLRRTFGSQSASPELAEALLGNQCHRRNTSIGEYNRTGKQHRSHYDTWLLDEIVEISLHVGTKPSFPIPRLLSTRIATSETFGIIPVSTSLTSQLNIRSLPRIRIEGVPHDRDTPAHIMTRFSTKTTNSYHFLQQRQRVTTPVLPIHTYAEFKYFKEVLNSGKFTVGRKQDRTDFEKLAQFWNQQVDLQDPGIHESNQRLYYKLPELLEAHHKKGVQWRAERATVLAGQNAAALEPIHQLLSEPERYTQTLAARLLCETDTTVNANPLPTDLAFETSVPSDGRFVEMLEDYVVENEAGREGQADEPIANDPHVDESPSVDPNDPRTHQALNQLASQISSVLHTHTASPQPESWIPAEPPSSDTNPPSIHNAGLLIGTPFNVQGMADSSQQ
ncbi:hypothetical protein PQX77_006590, partial [Marasmius sp. AFHP31]